MERIVNLRQDGFPPDVFACWTHLTSSSPQNASLELGGHPLYLAQSFIALFFGSLQTYCRVLINVSDSRYMSLSVFMCHIVVY